MSDSDPTMQPGMIAWHDLTVPPHTIAAAKAFYQAVVGWSLQPHPMGEYDDYDIQADGTTVAGLCQARGSNADLPPHWLIYVPVPDVDAACTRASTTGGRVLAGPRMMGGYRFAVLQDPAGAALAIVSHPPESAAGTNS